MLLSEVKLGVFDWKNKRAVNGNWYLLAWVFVQQKKTETFVQMQCPEKVFSRFLQQCFKNCNWNWFLWGLHPLVNTTSLTGFEAAKCFKLWSERKPQRPCLCAQTFSALGAETFVSPFQHFQLVLGLFLSQKVFLSSSSHSARQSGSAVKSCVRNLHTYQLILSHRKFSSSAKDFQFLYLHRVHSEFSSASLSWSYLFELFSVGGASFSSFQSKLWWTFTGQRPQLGVVKYGLWRI